MSRQATAELGRLCIFARAPERGAVKQRLASALGADLALHAHKVLVERCLTRLAGVAVVTAELWIAGQVEHPGAVRWAARWALPLKTQQGADLGERMAQALAVSLAAAPFAMIVGTDCPPLSADYIAAAAGALADHDLVLGPAEDGGYGLIGLRQPVPELFVAMPWGTSSVTAETLARAQRKGLRVALLDELWDVDTAADWQRFRATQD